MPDRPAVSVLLPTYNSARFLGAAVRSLLRQDFRNFELIVVNDGSTDDSQRILEGFYDARIRIIRTENRGLVQALNLAFEASSGLYVARMDADDIAREDRLGVQWRHLEEHPGTGVVCSDVRIIDAQDKPLGFQRERWTEDVNLSAALRYRTRLKPIIHPSVMLRRHLIAQVGGYRDITTAEDRDLWLRLVDLTKFDRIPADLLDYRIHAGGLSRDDRSLHEAASLMTVVNAIVRDEARTDLFAERKDIFDKLHVAVRQVVRTELEPVSTALDTARTLMRGGHRLRAMTLLAKQSVAEKRILGPDASRIMALKVIRAHVDLARAALARG